MTMLSAKLDHLLNSIEQDGDPSEYIGSSVPYMIDCLLLCEPRMPPVAAASFRISKDYRDGLTPLRSVSHALEACWEEFRRDHREMRLDDPEVSAIRAVICVLHRQQNPESGDFLDSLSFFLVLVNNVEPHIDQQEALLQKHFASCLRDGPSD